MEFLIHVRSCRRRHAQKQPPYYCSILVKLEKMNGTLAAGPCPKIECVGSACEEIERRAGDLHTHADATTHAGQVGPEVLRHER